MKDWGRLITAMVTPFDSNLEIDYGKAAELAGDLAEKGTTALVVSGTTGEAPTLTADEKFRLFRTVKEAVDIPVIAGIGTNSTSQTIEMGLKAVECGVDGALAVVPYYNKPPQASLYQHFKKVAEEVHLPILMYNIPGRTGRNMEAETTIALSKVPGIVAVKEASGDLDQATKIIQGTDSAFLVYTGEDSLTLPTIAVGGYGVVSVLSHVAGPQMSDMISAYVKGDTAKAASIHQSLYKLTKALFVTTNPIPVKCALNITGIEVGGLRLPLTEAGEDVRKLLEKELGDLNII